MKYRNFPGLEREGSVISLGTWAFGSDAWWGSQDDKNSFAVLEKALELGINIIDTAPVYGRGHSEEIIGQYLKKFNTREEVILATKLGLSWKGPRIFHDLKREKMLQELDESRKRLQTDYFDIYQVHWPDPDTPIRQTAELMNEFYKKGIIKAVGVSNYSVGQMREFMKYCPVHTLQPPYNMFIRGIEEEIVPFCIENGIAIISYTPLQSGILTGKFFFEGVKVPQDMARRNHQDLQKPRWDINKETLGKLKDMAAKYNKSLTQLVLNWTCNRRGITSVIAGARKVTQIEENAASADWEISQEDRQAIDKILEDREEKI